MEERVYQGFIYRRAGPGQPWQQVGPAPGAQAAQPRQGRIYTDPTQERDQARKDAAEVRANEDQNIQRGRYDLSRGDEQRSSRREALDNPQALRKEYAALPEVKEYKIAAQMASSALNTAANPQGDIALVYAFAKAMDPGSVVRDQETNMVTASQPWFQTMVQNVKKQFGMDGTGNFTPQSRAAIRQEVMRALASRKPLYEARRAEMVDLAMANRIPPMQVIGKSDTELYAPSFKAYAEKNGDDGNVIAGLLGVDAIPRADAGPAGPAPQAAGSGVTTGSAPIDPKMQQAHSEYLAQNWGHIDPQDYAAFRINLDKQYGFGSDPEAYAGAVPGLNELAAKGGAPNGLTIPAVKKDLSGFDQFRNNIVSNPVGAGAYGAVNSATFGVPSLFARAQTEALREEYPVSSFVGDIGGAMAGTGIASAGLRHVGGRLAEGAVAKALANPLTADAAYGAAYGATQAEDPLYGAVGGAVAGVLGNRVGRAVGKAFPGLTGTGKAIRDADSSVPTSQALKDEASSLYSQAEANGLTATPDETFALADRIGKLLSDEGVMSPTGRLSDVNSHSKDAYKLIEDYAGDLMTPKQIQTVRGRIADGLGSQEPGEKRIARLLLNEFDQWTDATNPALASGLKDARGVASRYLQGDQIAKTRALADVRAGQFSDSGSGNALRTDFRQLDRGIANGSESFAPGVEAAVKDVARGTPIGNALRNVGRFAPTGGVSSIPTLLAMSGGGAAAGPAGAAGGAALGGLALLSRKLGQRVTDRSAQVAENIAYGGPAYEAMLADAMKTAAIRGGHGGAATSSEVARLLADMTGY